MAETKSMLSISSSGGGFLFLPPGGDLLRCGRLPHLGRLVCAAGDDPLAVRAKGITTQLRAVPFEGEQLREDGRNPVGVVTNDDAYPRVASRTRQPLGFETESRWDSWIPDYDLWAMHSALRQTGLLRVMDSWLRPFLLNRFGGLLERG